MPVSSVYASLNGVKLIREGFLLPPARGEVRMREARRCAGAGEKVAMMMAVGNEARVKFDRVVAQGDLRPMAGSKEAMEDLKRILAGRSELYGRADMSFDTSERTLADAYLQLRDRLAARLAAELGDEA